MRRKYTLEEKLETLFVVSLSIGALVGVVLWIAMLVMGILGLANFGRLM